MNEQTTREFGFFELLNIIAFLIAIENLEENRQQSRHNDVQAANDRQARRMMKEINKRFDEQNKILERQNALINELMRMISDDK